MDPYNMIRRENMIKKISIVIGIILCLTLIFMPQTKIAKVEKKEMKDTEEIAPGYYIYPISVRKTDENGQPLSGAEFSLTNLDGDVIDKLTPLAEPGKYSLTKYETATSEKLYKILSKNEQKKLDSLKTKEDLEAYARGDGDIVTLFCEGNVCEVVRMIALLLAETKAPSGYIKEKFVFPAHILYEFSLENNQITERNVMRLVTFGGPYLTYKEDGDYENFFENAMNGKYDNDIVYDCPTKPHAYSIEPTQTLESRTASSCEFPIINKKGSVLLAIDNFINNTYNYATTANQTLNYRVVVQNNGTASSLENIITTNLPEGINYVEESATHNGKYNKELNRLEWNFDEIEAKETVELQFRMSVPEGADLGKKYIATSTIQSKEVPIPTTSKQAIVSILSNPATSTPAKIIVINVLILLGIGSYLFYYQKKKAKQQ